MKDIERIEKINWWHSIELPDYGVTKGRVGSDHCSAHVISDRFGMPEDLLGKTVLDIGTFDGLFAFEAEKRGAKVTAIDCYQSSAENGNGFMLAKGLLESDVEFYHFSLKDFVEYGVTNYFDICLYYGVLYHVENPLRELSYLSQVTKEFALIESAIIQNEHSGRNIWEFNNGFDNDKTNFWYCSFKGLESVLKYVGFREVQLVWTDAIRMTVKAIK